MTPVRLEPGPRGGEGVLRYFHTYVGSGHFLGFKILNFNIFWGLQKKIIFLRVLRFCGYFFFFGGGGGVITNWTIFSGYFNAF